MHILKETFLHYFGGDGSGIRVFTAPGRVNLIGEHTDYNGGFVFPAALTMATTVLARPRKDRQINLIATDLKQMVHANLDELEQYKGLKWGSYQLGVADELQKAGYRLCGCDLLYDDKVPLGSGLSSSAAIEIATAIALVSLGNTAYHSEREIDMVQMAKIAQIAEHNYIGVKCGIMDQFSSAMGKKDMALFLDCRDLVWEMIPLKMEGYRLVLSNTNKKRSLGEGKYNERRSECEKGLAYLKQALPDATCLREVCAEEFAKHNGLIPDETIRKRVEHVVYENDRVLQSVKALKEGRLNEFGKLMNASHDSLRDLYEVTGIELDTLVEEARRIDGVLGARMTGAGFGGCTVSLVREEQVQAFITMVGAAYESRIGYPASFYVSEIGDGGREVF
ncbi:MAG: galactokinase [Thermoclostridium sp.]|nr:galactokinase [Thermoclostridium sp.]